MDKGLNDNLVLFSINWIVGNISMYNNENIML
jgi:hypothetical protein